FLTTLPNHVTNPYLIHSLNSFNDPSISDFVLVLGYKRLYLHRSMLAKRSPYFKRMLSTEWADKNEVKVDLFPLYPIYFNYIRFLYTEHWDLEVDWVLELYALL